MEWYTETKWMFGNWVVPKPIMIGLKTPVAYCHVPVSSCTYTHSICMHVHTSICGLVFFDKLSASTHPSHCKVLLEVPRLRVILILLDYPQMPHMDGKIYD